jgi:hypothetical protein
VLLTDVVCLSPWLRELERLVAHKTLSTSGAVGANILHTGGANDVQARQQLRRRSKQLLANGTLVARWIQIEGITRLYAFDRVCHSDLGEQFPFSATCAWYVSGHGGDHMRTVLSKLLDAKKRPSPDTATDVTFKQL